MLVAFALSVIVFVRLHGLDEESRSIHSVAWTWLQSGDLHVDNSILVDQLSAVMLLVVTGVGFLIHVYSVGYMHGDLEERRYFAYLNLFVFSMLILVLAANFVVLLVGWGMVGLSSYLLIGFWHQKPSAVAAAKKAFVMNAIGDVGMAIGIFMIFRELGTVDYIEVFGAPRAARRRHVDDQLDLRAAADRRPREVGAAAAAHVAARRHGGPDAGLRPHPRRHHGDGRRVPDRAHEPALLVRADASST